MKYEWDTSLETGNEKVDNQHKQLISYLNNLIDAHEQGKSEKELQKTLEFLTAYTVKHFYDEEMLQKKHDYPDYLRHKSYHDAFKKTAAELSVQLKESGYSYDLVEEAIKAIGNWLSNHIKGDDFKMAAYVKDNENGKK